MFLIYHETRKLYLSKPQLNANMFTKDRLKAYEFDSKELAQAIYDDDRLWREDVLAEKHLIKIIEEREVK